MKTDNQVALEIVETVKSFKIYMTKRPLKNWICKKVTDKNHYIFNLMGDLCRNEFERIPMDSWRYFYCYGKIAIE